MLLPAAWLLQRQQASIFTGHTYRSSAAAHQQQQSTHTHTSKHNMPPAQWCVSCSRLPLLVSWWWLEVIVPVHPLPVSQCTRRVHTNQARRQHKQWPQPAQTPLDHCCSGGGAVMHLVTKSARPGCMSMGRARQVKVASAPTQLNDERPHSSTHTASVPAQPCNLLSQPCCGFAGAACHLHCTAALADVMHAATRDIICPRHSPHHHHHHTHRPPTQ